MYFFQEKLLFPGTTLPLEHEFSSKYPFEELDLKAADGASINCVHYQLENPRGLIVYYHGNGRTIEDWMNEVEPLVKMNFDLLLMDYRQYGKSRGKQSEANMIADALMVYDYAKGKAPENKIILYGRSMGTAFASQVAAVRSPSLMILESPFKSIIDMGSRNFPFLPQKLLSRYPLRSDLAAAKVKCPVHIMHGNEDRVVPFDSGKQLHACYPKDQAKFYVFKGAGHNDMMDRREYSGVVSEILSVYQPK